MSKIQKALAVLFVATLGIWGCAQGSAGSASADRLKALEAKANRLEEDFRSATAARDQLRKKLATAEETVSQLRQEIEQLTAVVKERDDLKAQLKSRTDERDLLSTNFDQFRKNLKDLLGKTEATLSKGTATTTTPPVAPDYNTETQFRTAIGRPGH